MKEYVKLSVDAEAYYSGNTYYEELFLPKDVWDKIQSNVRMYLLLHEFDGKHSEVRADIDVEIVDEGDLISYISQGNDGERLFYHIDENYLYDNEDVGDIDLNAIQEVAYSLSQVDTMTIKYKAKDKDRILELLKDFII